MPETPNHDYNVPNEGEQDWHEPLNENFEAYDTDIEIRDQDANRGNYEPKQGAKFLATDTGTVYLGDGSSWQQAFDLGGIESVNGVEADANGALGVSSPDGSIEVAADQAGNAIELGVADGAGSGSGLSSIGGVGPDDQGNVDLESSDDSVELDFDAAGNSIDLGLPEAPTFDQLNPDNDFLGVGRSNPIGQEDFGIQSPTSDGYGGMYINTEGNQGDPFYGYATGGNYRAWHYYDGSTMQWRLNMDGNDRVFVSRSGRVGIGDNASAGRLHVIPQGNDVRAIRAEGDVRVDEDLQVIGDLDVNGNKNFTQTVDTDDGEREVVYTATEAGTPHTEASGVAELEDGRAEVELPEHFAWVTSGDEPLMVQVTPHASEPVRPQVTERSTDRIVVEDFGDGTGSYEMSYTVKGTREGHADKEVVREPSASADHGDPAAPADD